MVSAIGMLKSQQFQYVFDDISEQFTDINSATALEVSFALTKTMRDRGSNGFASVFVLNT
jgi:hypothetical protein